MIHRAHSSPQQATASKLEDITRSLRIDDARIEAILREHIKLDDKQWGSTQLRKPHVQRGDSLNIGFAQEILEFAPPPGSKIFTV